MAKAHRPLTAVERSFDAGARNIGGLLVSAALAIPVWAVILAIVF